MNKVLPFLLISILTFSSCSDDDDKSVVIPTDYSNPNYWISLPESTPKQADIFYVYPTVYLGENKIADVNDASYRASAKYTFEGQATAFETAGNVFAPYYRQCGLGAMLSSAEEKAVLIKAEPVTDVTAAFDYYIKHYNNGRPYVLAAHSQGSNILLFLLSDYMKKNPEVYNRMIAAYVIGYPVTQKYLDENSHLKFAENALDSKVIISYNTEAPVIEGENVVLRDGKGLCINPLSWTRTDELAGVELNRGTYKKNADQTGYDHLPPMPDAQIDLERSVVICTTANVDEYYFAHVPVFVRGNFHSGDYPFYYFNIRKNAEDRVNAYLDRK